MFFLVQVPSQIHEGRVRNACDHKNNIAGDSNGNQCLCIIGAQKCAPCEQDCVQKLGYQSGAIIPDPQEFLGVPEPATGERPPFMICPHIEKLDNDVYNNSYRH